MFKASTFIFSVPNRFTNGFSTFCSTKALIFSGAILRILAILLTCTKAPFTLIFGSNPLPDAVTKSEGISDLLTVGLCTKNVSILLLILLVKVQHKNVDQMGSKRSNLIFV